MNYYNEFDPKAAAWLRELIAAGLIPDGDVDERSIADVRASELMGYTQCHFFAGIGGWSEALRLAGWPEDKPVWTGSCPCQAFSTAGKQRGFDDERDLWPVFAGLIRECQPQYVFGEQVENAIKHGWLDRVYAGLEGEGYAVGAVVLGAHSVGAPHRRQRLYWGAVAVADANGTFGSVRTIQTGRQSYRNDSAIGGVSDGDDELRERNRESWTGRRGEFTNRCGGLGVADCEGQRRGEARRAGERPEERIADGGAIGGMDDLQSDGWGVCNSTHIRETAGEINAPANAGCSGGDMGNAASGEQRRDTMPGEYRERVTDRGSSGNGRLADCDDTRLERRGGSECAAECAVGARGLASLPPWSSYRLIYCRDGKIRRVPAESILFGVADGFSSGVDGGGVIIVSEDGGFPLTTKKEGRAVLLKGYGNAIVPQVAAEFVMAFVGAVKES